MIVGALCIRDEKILMAKRNIHPRKGLWTLPAGFMENAETLQAGALRETMEETGSEAKVIMPYTMFSLPHINQVHLFYLADLLDENFGPTSESMEVKLFSKDEILWNELAFPTVERTLKYYIEDSENSQLQSSPEMYSLSIKETQDVMSIVGREIQLTKDYTTGNATFKQGSRGTVIEATSRKDGKLKVKLDNDNEKTFRLIKECDLQLYEGGPLSSSSESQTAETSFEY